MVDRKLIFLGFDNSEKNLEISSLTQEARNESGP